MEQRVASVSLEVTLDNGNTIRHEVASVSDAIEYLKRQVYEAVRRVERD